jgi:methionyl aminopeptidase
MALPPPITNAEIELAYAAAQKVVETHRRVAAWLKPGVTLAQVDAFIAKALADLSCRSCFLGYQVPRTPRFPSHSCLSVNECVVHGTAGSLARPLRQGDLLKVDIGVFHQGWVGDAGWTYSFGEPEPNVRKLMECGKESLRRGIETLRPGNTFLQWAKVVEGYVEGECGFHLIRGLGGHGYGRKLHAAPYVSNTLPSFPGEWPDSRTACRPGTLVAVEPMLAIGTGDTQQHDGEWPVLTADGSMSVHYEHDVLITESGPRVLTEGMDELPDVIG